MRRVECPLKCGEEGLRYHQLQQHIEEDCPRRKLGKGSRGDGGGVGRPGSRGANSSSKKDRDEKTAIGTKVVSPLKPSS